jgi:hypothetical protein
VTLIFGELISWVRINAKTSFLREDYAPGFTEQAIRHRCAQPYAGG